MATADISTDSANAASEVWRGFWFALDEFVADFRNLCGSHLRHAPIELRMIDECGGSQRAMLSIGSTELVLDCPRYCLPPSKGELALARAFGVGRPLVRIFVLRKLAYASHGWHVESTLVADPASRTWIATEPELGPAPLADATSLEPFFWYLVVDRRA
jgi:hypothetical protein